MLRALSRTSHAPGLLLSRALAVAAPLEAKNEKLSSLLSSSSFASAHRSTATASSSSSSARFSSLLSPTMCANASSAPERTSVCIIGSGPAAHTAAIYAARAELKPILFEGWLANGIAAGGQLTTTTDVENFPGFPEGIMGGEITDKFRAQSSKFGTKIYSETVTKVDLSRRPFRVSSADGREVLAETVVVATGAVAKRLDFPGSGEGEGGFWNKGVSACAVCDGAAPMFRGKPLAVVGGGDTAMEEALFLTKYGSKVHIIHRRDELRASKVMQRRALEHPKIEMVWSSACVEACGAKEADGSAGSSKLGSIRVKNLKTEEVSEIECSGLFFAIGHEPASKFLGGQLELDADGYIATKPGTVETSVAGVFACGDVQDKKWRQAITAAGTGCMAALSAEHFLVEHGSAGEAEQAAEELARGAQVASPDGAAAAAAKKKAVAGGEQEGVKERAVPSVAGKERVPA